ncbi:DUF1805 domain-containing protein [Cohnella lubricantis]|uniref:DUF1805 domain-containing protein n=1 Tax=Cohnella lubricantis TaxID=2163172 RepID=A0A841TBS8_9BACL|nr:DUF1805 domain-containing protein [Cohnella lubricantis]MBB6677479.1 DUF1805 domain-containing protein [Cohnella lubricantis]MBP2116635.1 uncharacterized protein YunC (DUF1805 family) [Cohnella lubricantis]
MMRLVPIDIEGQTALGAEVLLPGTTLLAITIGGGYIMCGALDVALLNERLGERRIIAGRAVGVRTFDQLLDAPLESVTDTARSLGIVPGMSGRDALAAMADASS